MSRELIERSWVGLTLLLTIMIGCSGSPPEDTYTQVDRVGRPSIAWLVTDDSLMNSLNEAAPTADTSPALEDVRDEMTTLLTAIQTYAGANGMSAPSSSTVLDAFLPDVIRIDTDLPLSGYTVDVATLESGAPLLVGGRLPTEDVFDIMLSYYFNTDWTGATIQDNITYAGPGVGVNPAAPGHDALLGTFPYLPAPY